MELVIHGVGKTIGANSLAAVDAQLGMLNRGFDVRKMPSLPPTKKLSRNILLLTILVTKLDDAAKREQILHVLKSLRWPLVHFNFKVLLEAFEYLKGLCTFYLYHLLLYSECLQTPRSSHPRCFIILQVWTKTRFGLAREPQELCYFSKWLKDSTI